MFHGYCIRGDSDPTPPAGLSGVDGAEVRSVRSHGLQIWLSDAVPIDPSIDRLKQHELVVRQALRTQTPLPLRYGTRFQSEDDAAEALRTHSEQFHRSLAELRDTVEMSLRISLTSGTMQTTAQFDEASSAHSPGRSYLERRRAELTAGVEGKRRADEILQEVEANLASLVLKTIREAAPAEDFVGSLAHLVHKGALRLYRLKIADIAEARADLKIAPSGPWAPYSFV